MQQIIHPGAGTERSIFDIIADGEFDRRSPLPQTDLSMSETIHIKLPDGSDKEFTNGTGAP